MTEPQWFEEGIDDQIVAVARAIFPSNFDFQRGAETAQAMGKLIQLVLEKTDRKIAQATSRPVIPGAATLSRLEELEQLLDRIHDTGALDHSIRVKTWWSDVQRLIREHT